MKGLSCARSLPPSLQVRLHQHFFVRSSCSLLFERWSGPCCRARSSPVRWLAVAPALLEWCRRPARPAPSCHSPCSPRVHAGRILTCNKSKNASLVGTFCKYQSVVWSAHSASTVSVWCGRYILHVLRSESRRCHQVRDIRRFTAKCDIYNQSTHVVEWCTLHRVVTGS